MTSPHVQEANVSGTKSGQDRFVFVVCQQGAERPLKDRFAGPGAALRLAFSRPGLTTFKTSGEQTSLLARSWLARVTGEGLGNVRGKIAEELVAQTLALTSSEFQAIHIFERDRELPGTRGFEPGPSPLTEAIGKVFADSIRSAGNRVPLINAVSTLGSKILDVILVEPDQWLIGTHIATEEGLDVGYMLHNEPWGKLYDSPVAAKRIIEDVAARANLSGTKLAGEFIWQNEGKSYHITVKAFAGDDEPTFRLTIKQQSLSTGKTRLRANLRELFGKQ